MHPHDPLPARLHDRRARWPGVGDHGGLLLPLPATVFAALPSTLRLDGLTLQRKDEFHLTVLNQAQLQSVRDNALLASLPRWFERLDWQVRSTRRYRWLQRDQGDAAQSIALIVQAPALQALRDRIAANGVALPPAWPHVTLYWHGDPRGIGVADPQQLRQRLRGGLLIDWRDGRAMRLAD